MDLLIQHQLWTPKKPSSIVVEFNFILALVLIIIGLLFIIIGYYRRKYISSELAQTGVGHGVFKD